ncbi:hypothetical protein Neosp_006198 [[Neocosmospora] mangrovei]
MANPSNVAETFQNTLDPFIKPREQVNYIRRVLALHLGSCSHDGPIKQPVSLTDTAHDVNLDPDSKGVYREYVEALKANVEARRKYDDIAQTNVSRPSSSQETPSNGTDLLEERVALLKLQTKQERLLAVQNHLDLLMQKPAAAPEYLDPEDVFHEAASLPRVPKEVVNGLVAQQSTKKPDLTEQVAQLEKTVLRAKLLLRREEQLLRETRANAQNIPDVISNGTRLHALNTTRNELITWIETELGKASTDEDGDEDAGGNAGGHDRATSDQASINAQLDAIKDKYAKKQKAMITQKAHINTTLGKEVKDSCQLLDHLTEESQLLPAHAVAPTTRRRSGLGEVLTSTERPGFTGKVQPWVLAADSAKIATLENVAEQVESGQLALEASMQTLQEIDLLLGQGEVEQEEEPQADTTEDDFWLAGSKTPSKARKHTEKKKDSEQSRDAWSGLHGNLGLIGQEDTA